jgi:hypothetical protein
VADKLSELQGTGMDGSSSALAHSLFIPALKIYICYVLLILTVTASLIAKQELLSLIEQRLLCLQ